MQEYASAVKVFSMFELLNGCTFCTKLWAFSPLPPLSHKIRLKLSQLGFSWQLELQLGLN